MTFRLKTFLAWRVASSAGLLVLAVSVSTEAQPIDNSVAGWRMACRDAQGCVIFRPISDTASRQPLRQIMFAIGPRPENIRLNIIGSNGLALDDRVRVVAGAFLRTLTVETCDDGWCLVAQALSPDTLTNMTQLPQMVLTLPSDDGDQVQDIAVPLDGLGAAIDAARGRL